MGYPGDASIFLSHPCDPPITSQRVDQLMPSQLDQLTVCEWADQLMPVSEPSTLPGALAARWQTSGISRNGATFQGDIRTNYPK